MAREKAFPKLLYVKADHDSTETYWVASDDAYSQVEMGEKIKLGVYQLVEVQIGEGIAKLSPAKR